MSRAFEAACRRARELVDEPYAEAAPGGSKRRRFLVLGDPQAPLERVLRALDAQGVLGEDGRLVPDAGLVSMGDHFDFRFEPATAQAAATAGRDGLAFLRWLADHPPEQVFILAGNHDLCRVMELGRESDESWARAREVATRIGKSPPPEELKEFRAAFPNVPTPGIVLADYATFSEAQRTLVRALLLARRMRLGLTGRLAAGAQVLLTHAGVTRRELGLLGADPGAGAEDVRRRLDALLEQALGEVEASWRAGKNQPLSLHPVNVTGVSGEEGGGLLNHRPANPAWPKLNAAWAWRAESPRRFEPSWLPRGLVQVAGHTGHGMCRRELHTWAERSPEGSVSLRTLRAGEASCSYSAGLEAPEPDSATLYLVDPEFSKAEPERMEFLWLDAVDA